MVLSQQTSVKASYTRVCVPCVCTGVLQYCISIDGYELYAFFYSVVVTAHSSFAFGGYPTSSNSIVKLLRPEKVFTI